MATSFLTSAILPALVALAGLTSSVEGVRNTAAPAVIVPLTFSYNTTFSIQSPVRFLAATQIGTPPQNLTLALDISRPDIEIRHDFGLLPNNPQFRSLLFKNMTSDSFIWGEPENDVNGWLGPGPVDNFSIGNLRQFRTGWNRWNHTETINLSTRQREEMVAYSISGYLGLHGPDCAVKGKSWYTSLVANGGSPFRTWGLYFDGGLVDPVNGRPSTHLDSDNPRYSGILLMGGYQPAITTGTLTAVANITYTNNTLNIAAPAIPPLANAQPMDPHLLRMDHMSINAQRTVVPESRDEGWLMIRPESIFSNFSTRAQAAQFATAVGATANDIGNGRTVYTFPDCTAAVPSQNVELVFPAMSAGKDQKRINLPTASLKIQKEGTCYLSFQEPYDPTVATNQLPRGVLGLSFLRNIYLHVDYDNGAYFIAPRLVGPSTSPKALSVFAAPNAPKFVLPQCWGKEGTPTGVIKGEYQENWYRFPAAFMEYYLPIVGPPWLYRITPEPEKGIIVLSLVVLPLSAVLVIMIAFINTKVLGSLSGAAVKKV
ncbi:hypothetical protein DFH27DRAFT_523825 [Peziza echinospora]|nr:hypothetical protein DFH27DRAFT_523825 [Peziza echinospora]